MTRIRYRMLAAEAESYWIIQAMTSDGSHKALTLPRPECELMKDEAIAIVPLQWIRAKETLFQVQFESA